VAHGLLYRKSDRPNFGGGARRAGGGKLTNMSMPPPPVRLLLLTLLLSAALPGASGVAAVAAADRVVYQRAGTLYLLEDGRAMPLSGIGRVPAAPALWAVSPDGGRVAWAVPAAVAAAGPPPRGRLNDEGEGEVPPPGGVPDGAASGNGVALYVAELAGQRQGGPPRRLLSTDSLKDRQGRRVTSLSGEGGGALSSREPVSLGWSADGRTLYLGFAAKGRQAAATVAADVATGAPLVDASGRWKALAPITHADARGLTLAGIGSTGGKESLTVVNLPEAKRAAIAPEGVTNLRDPALAPDGSRIAFAGVPAGLYLVTADGKQAAAVRAVTGEVARPRWSRDGKRLLFLVPRPSVGSGPTLYDLFVVTAPGAAGAPPPDSPRRLRENVEAFDVAAG